MFGLAKRRREITFRQMYARFIELPKEVGPDEWPEFLYRLIPACVAAIKGDMRTDILTPVGFMVLVILFKSMDLPDEFRADAIVTINRMWREGLL